MTQNDLAQESYEQSKAVLAFDNQGYLASSTVWSELVTETARLNKLIDSGAKLTPDDVKDVSRLAKTVKNYGVLYRRAVTKTATNYKDLLNQRLSAIGYDKIEDYVEARKREASNAREDRLNQKVDKFNQLVATELSKSKVLQNSSIARQVAPDLGRRFPKLNSGAKNKEIKDWEPVEAIVRLSILTADKAFIDHPTLKLLPNYAHSVSAINQYLATGDDSLIKGLDDKLKEDQDLLRKIAIKQKVKTDHDALSQIELVLKSSQDDHVKLTYIKRLIDTYFGL